MKIGLLDVDNSNKFPNLPLMKLSAWHKSNGDHTEIYNQMNQYDRVYMSKIFTNTPDYLYYIDSKEIIKGGTGYFYPDGGKPLPDEVEHIYPNYELYGITDTAYGFLTRGCPRNCPFCIVGKKEGLRSYKVANLNEFWKDQKYIEIMDPNILACNEASDLLQQCIKSKATINFNQGLDCRLLNDENIQLLNQIKMKDIHFAFDRLCFEESVLRGLRLYREKGKISPNQVMVYILANFETTHEQDLQRVNEVIELGYNPYLMVYERWNAPQETKDLQRWCNRIWVRKACTFEEYKQENETIPEDQMRLF